MTTKTPIALAAALLALPLAGCDQLFYVETEIAEACVQPPPQDFLGTSANASFRYEYDLGGRLEVLEQEHVTYEVRLTEVDAALVTTGVNLANVERVRLFAVSSSGLPDVLLAQYVKSPSNPSPTRIDITGNPNIDLGPYLESGVIGLRLDMEGTPATVVQPFTAEFDACFFVKAKLDYDKYVF